MYQRLTEVDDLIRPDHHHLSNTDICYFFGEYTARKGFHHSATNQLISNFKKCPSRVNQFDYRYKNQAISTIADELCAHINPATLTFVPVPPSKAKDHELYDDRLQKVLIRYSQLSNGVDWREIIFQSTSTRAAHSSDDRLTLEELKALYRVDQTTLHGVRDTIVVFDDVLTTGCHFKAVKQVLTEAFPNKSVVGIFIARRVPEADPLDIF